MSMAIINPECYMGHRHRKLPKKQKIGYIVGRKGLIISLGKKAQKGTNRLGNETQNNRLSLK